MTHAAIRFHDSPPEEKLFDTGEGSVLTGYQPRNTTAWAKPIKRNRKVDNGGWIISAPVAPVLLAFVLLGIAFLAGYNVALHDARVTQEARL